MEHINKYLDVCELQYKKAKSDDDANLWMQMAFSYIIACYNCKAIDQATYATIQENIHNWTR